MDDILKKLSIKEENYGSCVGGENWLSTSAEGVIESVNPSNGKVIARVFKCSESDYDRVLSESNGPSRRLPGAKLRSFRHC